MRRLEFDSYNDDEIVNGLLANDSLVIEYFFYEKCGSLLGYIIKEIFQGQIQKNEFVSELFIYLSQREWYKLRQFDYRSRLTTWLSVVATRFFIKNKDWLIEKYSVETQNNLEGVWDPFPARDTRRDILKAIEMMENAKYRKLIIDLDINEIHPAKVADELGVSLANLYNLHSRARAQLKKHMNKEDYYD